MSKHTNILATLLLFVLFTSCGGKKAVVSDSEMETKGFVKAMVVAVELDGCRFMLELASDKSKLEPDGLQPEFQSDSLPVWIKYKVVERLSVCMAGTTVELQDIKKR